MDEFSELKRYIGCWPINDILKLYLKNSRAKYKRARKIDAMKALLS